MNQSEINKKIKQNVTILSNLKQSRDYHLDKIRELDFKINESRDTIEGLKLIKKTFENL